MPTWAAAMAGHAHCPARARLASRSRARSVESDATRRTASATCRATGATARTEPATSGPAGRVEMMGKPCSAQASKEPRRAEAPSAPA